jgi:CsoR family transcriptional regulator, copper-sensing transcriptional repressor
MVGYSNDKAQLRVRLRRIEGQVRGIQRMVEEDSYCIDILTQITAITGALNKVAVSLLEDHLGHCVADSIAGGEDADAKVKEASAAVQRLLRA